MHALKLLTLSTMFCLPIAAVASTPASTSTSASLPTKAAPSTSPTPPGLASTPLAAAHRLKVLIVVSGEGRDQGKTRPGYEFDELSQAWLIFRDNGLDVEVASPQGGPVEAGRYNAQEPFNAQLLADAQAMRTLANTRATRELRAEDYAAVYVVGGKGAMFDLPKDTSLQKLLSSVYERGAIVAAVCHGPAALAEVRLSDGARLVAGKSLTGFSNEEEAIFGKKWAREFPWQLEDALRERGARWEEAALMMPKVVVDGQLITGQNPYSATGVAEAIVSALGRTPAPRMPWRDELSLELVMQLLARDASAAQAADAELSAHKENYHVELIGLLGYYQLQTAPDIAAVRDAVSIMELAAPHMAQPELVLGLADGYSRLGDSGKARNLLQGLLAKSPDMPEARALLEKLDDTP